MPDNRNSPPGAVWDDPIHDNWSDLLRRYVDRLEEARRAARARMDNRWDDIWRISYDASINDNIPVWYEMDKKDTNEMPIARSGACSNCGNYWGRHSGWACPTFAERQHQRKRWCRSELSPKDRYLTPDMKGIKKYSCVSQKRLRKLEREQILAKESLLK